MASKPLKVSEVNKYIKHIFSGDWILSNIKVEGEISNFKHHYSGHMYFSLKDEKGKLRCVMFKNYNQQIDLNIKDGDQVVASGYVSVYEREGSYQLYVTNIEQNGAGELFEAFERLKDKLEKEGLFENTNKKKIPAFPKKLGVVTSSTGAAIRDIITVIKRRFPIVDILIYPVLVQGINAPKSICEGLNYLDRRDDVDAIIVGRGGGSIEELFAFNNETLARTIYSIDKPVISAVGHETDFTIADFVADLRAPTPSAAAEITTPEIDKLINNLDDKYTRLNKYINYAISDKNIRLNYINSNLNFHNPKNRAREMTQQQDDLLRKLMLIMKLKLKSNRDKINSIYKGLNYLSPISSLERGYGLISDLDGNIIKSTDNLEVDKELNILVKDGIIKAKVVKINKGEFDYEN